MTTNSKCGGISTHVRTVLTVKQLPRTPPDAALPLTRSRSDGGIAPPPPSPQRAPGPWDACVTGPSSRAPTPSCPRHVTRHAPAARGLHQNKNRGGWAAAGARGDGGARGRQGAGAPPPPLPSAAAAPKPPRAPRAARPGRLGPGGQRAPPCLQPSLLAEGGDPARKRSPRRKLRSAYPPLQGRSLLGIKASPRPWGRARAGLRSSSARRPRGFMSAPVTTLLRTSRSSLSSGASADHPHVAAASLPRHSPATRAVDPRALRDPEPAPTRRDVTPLGPPSPPLLPRGEGGDTHTSCQKPSFLPDEAHPHP